MILRILCLAAGVLLAAPAPAVPPQWGGSVTLASNHLLRGVSRSSNDPALSAQLEMQSSQGWLISLWGSTSRVRSIDSTTVELAGTLGYARAMNDDWTLVGSYTHYESPWGYRPTFYRYDEFTVDVHFRESLLLSVSYSPDVSRYSASLGPVWQRNAWAYEATWQHDLRPHLRGWVGLGYYDLSDLFGDGYWYGSVGLGWRQGHWQFDASYVIPDHSARYLSYPESASRRALAAVSYAF